MASKEQSREEVAGVRRVAFAGAAVNILIAGAKFAGGVAFSSQALLADAVHSLSDLDKLKITEERFELCGFVEEAVREIGAEQGDINFIPCGREIYISGDRSRLLQLCENLINNARKYAKTSVDVSITAEEGSAVLTFRDHGKGIPDEDIPFIFDKFYRGHNSQGEQGSGLGLYIVRYIAQRHGGSVSLRSCPDGGLEVSVVLPAETEEHNGE